MNAIAEELRDIADKAEAGDKLHWAKAMRAGAQQLRDIEALRHGAPYFSHYQQALGDAAVLLARVQTLEEGIRLHLKHHENGCTYLSHLMAPNAELTGAARHGQQAKPQEVEK